MARSLPLIQYLDVYLRGSFIGKLSSEKAVLGFEYDLDYLKRPDAVKLSTSLPFLAGQFDHQVTSAYFSNLLPEEDVRRRLARYLGISEKNTFALLKEIGGECAGAVSVYPGGISPDLQDFTNYLILNDDEADEILSALDKRPMMAGEGDIRISGAGAQDKLMIAFVDGKIAIPKGSAPSTHIIKPGIKDISESVHNEFFCMKLAKAVGLPVPEVQIYWLKDKPYYLVERYDRQRNGDGSVTRLHQEDFCQAMQFPPEMKYESEGGPSLEQCFSLLDERIKSGSMAGKNKITFLKGVIFNFLIGNGDAHGKNFSMLFDGEIETLAPFYDLLCTLVYSNDFKAKMAMKIDQKYKFKEISLSRWDNLGKMLGFRPEFVRRQINILNNDIAKAAIALWVELQKDPLSNSEIYEKIIGVIIKHHRRMSAT